MTVYHDYEYLKLVERVLDEGVYKPNRTGVGTLSIFGYQMRFNLRDGTIPLLTTKKMHTRSIFHEIIWYLQGSGDVNYLNQHQITIWDEWKNGNNQLGPVYGAMWRAYPPPAQFSPTPKRNVVDNTSVRSWVGSSVNCTLMGGKYANQAFTNYQGLQYVVLGVDGHQPNGRVSRTTTYAIQFLNSGWIKYGVSTRLVKTGKFNDQSIPSVYGVGMLGDYESKKESVLHKQLRRTWELMISRCYNQRDIAYETHGGAGVRVCERWKVLSDFIQDVKHLPNWFVKQQKDNYVLDKDYYGNSTLYHPDACVWIERAQNNLYRKNAKPVVLVSNTDTLFFPCESTAAKFLSVSPAAVKARLMKKVNTEVNGFKVSPFYSDDYVIRKPNTIDQIANVIRKLKANPHDRRLVVSGWHPGLLPLDGVSPDVNASLGYQALPPCHYTFQFYTRPIEDGKYELSLMLNQRSCDVGLGVPFNIAQYATLLHMVAQVVGMKVGEFIWSGGDVHIYENHVDQLREQLSRPPYPSPLLMINPNITDIDEFKFEDLSVAHYLSHLPIKMDVAV